MSARDTVGVTPLRVERLTLEEAHARWSQGDALGGLYYGAAEADAAFPDVGAPQMGLQMPQVDLWQTREAADPGALGCVRWRCDGHWMMGSIDLDEAHGPGDLAAQAALAYRDLFQALDATGCRHLQRLWNYLPQIHGDGGGLERYRQFNLGRQQAFLDAGRAAFEGAPAACALGVQHGALRIRFLAGRHAPRPVENPRQVSAYRYPERYGPRAPTFSRAALADVGDGQIALFISGTASIVGHETLHAGDLAAQTHETLRNLAAVIAAAHEGSSARFAVDALDAVVYVRHPADMPRVRELLAQAFGPDAPTVRRALYLEADICRQDLLVEIEAHAVAPGVLAA